MHLKFEFFDLLICSQQLVLSDCELLYVVVFLDEKLESQAAIAKDKSFSLQSTFEESLPTESLKVLITTVNSFDHLRRPVFLLLTRMEHSVIVCNLCSVVGF